MSKKFLVILLAILTIISVTGCSKSSKATTTSKDKLTGSLNIWEWGAAQEAQARKDATEVFIKEHPGLKVTYTVIPTANSVWDQKSDAALAAGTAGDVMQISPDYYGMETKYFIDLNPLVKKDGIDLNSVVTPGLMNGYYDTDGKLEGMPLHTNCFEMAYNKDMFSKAGVTAPADGWTLDDLLTWGKKFVGGSGASETYAMAKHWVMDNLMLYSEGGLPYSSDLKTSNMGSDQIVKALGLYQKLIGEKIIPTDTAQQTIPAETLFVSGKAAMYPMGGFESSSVVADAAENGINIGFCEMPSDASGNEINVAYATGWAITKTCKNVDAAWAFLKESSYANDDMDKINATVGIPANKKVAEDYYQNLAVGDIKFKNTYYVQHISKAHLNPFGGTLASSGTLWTDMVQEVTLNHQDPSAVDKKYAPQIATEFAGYSFNIKS
jgi:multiple sugar transport system substrate-binding protein